MSARRRRHHDNSSDNDDHKTPTSLQTPRLLSPKLRRIVKKVAATLSLVSILSVLGPGGLDMLLRFVEWSPHWKTTTTTTTTTAPPMETASQPKLVIDVISIGSHSRLDYLITQQELYAPYIRNFYAVTEANDTETCQKVNETTVHTIRHACYHRQKTHVMDSIASRLYASPQYLSRKKPHASGWLCAQKRPIDALYNVLSSYSYNANNETSSSSSSSLLVSSSLPDYLFWMDDDTHVDWPAVLRNLATQNNNNNTVPTLTAGCLTRVRWANFSFPYGGWGQWMNKQVMRRWLEPLNCHNSSERQEEEEEEDLTDTNVTAPTTLASFRQQACRQWKQNLAGEAAIGTNEASTLLELMYRYVHQTSFDQFIANRQEHIDSLYCWHSDTVTAYFGNFYHLSDHALTAGDGHPRFRWKSPYEQDRWTGYRGSVRFAGRQLVGARKQKKECLHTNATYCTPGQAHLCHDIPPDTMRTLYAAIHKREAQ